MSREIDYVKTKRGETKPIIRLVFGLVIFKVVFRVWNIVPLVMGHALKLVWAFPRLSGLKWQTQQLDIFSPLVIIQEELTVKLFYYGRLRQSINIE